MTTTPCQVACSSSCDCCVCSQQDDTGGRKLSNITSMFTTKPLEKAKVGTSEAGAAVPWTYYVGWVSVAPTVVQCSVPTCSTLTQLLLLLQSPTIQGITGLCFGTFIAFNMLRVWQLQQQPTHTHTFADDCPLANTTGKEGE